MRQKFCSSQTHLAPSCESDRLGVKLECSEWNGLCLHPCGKHSNMMFLDRSPNRIVLNDLNSSANAIVHWTCCALFFKTMILKPCESTATLHHPPPLQIVLHFIFLCCIAVSSHMWMPGLQIHQCCSDRRRHNGPWGVMSARMMSPGDYLSGPDWTCVLLDFIPRNLDGNEF